MSSASGADIIIAHAGTPGVFFDGHTDATGATVAVGSSVTFKGQILLTHSEGDIVKISGDDVGELGFQAQASSSPLTPGSIIYDLAAIQGGNTACTKVDEVVNKNGVKIMGESNILNKLPTSASNLYAKNVFNFVSNLYDKENKKLNINL